MNEYTELSKTVEDWANIISMAENSDKDDGSETVYELIDAIEEEITGQPMDATIPVALTHEQAALVRLYE